MRDGLIEPVAIPDTFCSGLGAIENIGGGCLRFWLYVTQAPLVGEGPGERIVVCKVVAPITAVPDAVMQMLASMGGAAVDVIPLIGGILH